MMLLRYPTEWLADAANALSRLAENPWALFFVLLCINSIAQPYSGITHDARLYSGQTLNRVEDGAYADDIFFRYGSQDNYSLFSQLAAPLVRVLGVSTAFCLLYLAGKSLLVFGMMRVVQTLVPNRVAGTLALIYCMAFVIPYGGHRMLFVQESFVTPRMFACAMVLIGFDLLLRGRPIASGLAIGFAVGLHPLMAFGGLLVWAGYHVWRYLGITTFIAAGVGACALAAVVLGNESLGKRVFGEMDDVWRQSIQTASPFNFPSLWDWTDWLGLVFQLAILGVVIWKLRPIKASSRPTPLPQGESGEHARLLVVLMFVTIAGAVGATLAEQLPYALFQQGQPYRALWMLAFLHLPFAFWILLGDAVSAEPEVSAVQGSAGASPSRIWSRAAWQIAGCVVLAYLCSVNGMVAEYMLPLLLFPLLAVAYRGLEKEPHHPNWLPQSIQVSLVAGALGWGAYKFLLLVRGYEALAERHAELRDVAEVLLRNLGPVVVCAISCWILTRLHQPEAHATGSRRAPGLALGACTILLALQTFYFTFPETDFYLEHCTHYRADLRKVHDMLHRDRGASEPLPTVYCNLGCLDYVWLDLHSKSYFDWWQAGNYMFRREMAMEGRRRARLVGPLELAHYKLYEDQLAPGYKAVISRFFQTEFRHTLSQDDVVQLCREPGLDYLVLDQHIEGLNAVQVGRLYVYSCAPISYRASVAPRER